MVCAKCEAKLPKLIVADKWKAGAIDARKTTSASSGGSGSIGGVGVGAAGGGGGPAMTLRPCRLCKAKVHLEGAHYCQPCAYKNGICAMCGARVLATAGYTMSSR